MTTIESSIRQIDYPQQAVYSLLSDLGNIDKVKDRIPQDKIENLEFDHDRSPLPFNFWIQILPVTETTSKMKLTIKADINPFMASMVKKPLQQGIEKIADALQMIKYQ